MTTVTDVETLPLRTGREAFHHAISATHLPWDMRTDARTVAGSGDAVRRRRVGALSVVDCRAGPVSGRRGRRQIADSPDEHVGVLFVLAGREVVRHGDTEVVLTPGTAVLWDSTVPVAFAVSEFVEKRTLLLPRARLAELGGERVLGTVLPAGPATRLLRDFLGLVVAAEDAPPEAVLTATVDLLAAAVQAAAPAADDARWRAVRDHVEAHLADAALDPAAIARATAVSVRTLYELFAARGETVAGYVRRRRLARARAEIARAGRDVTVAAVARRWGFADAGTFTRAFRRQYGTTPGRLLPPARR